jgi:hypothetical protein
MIGDEEDNRKKECNKTEGRGEWKNNVQIQKQEMNGKRIRIREGRVEGKNNV